MGLYWNSLKLFTFELGYFSTFNYYITTQRNQRNNELSIVQIQTILGINPKMDGLFRSDL